jgi:BirA family transcriptional regulator, biotin operon repressor / biotin---[acetyl-CoA-carboxylase] ligase
VAGRFNDVRRFAEIDSTNRWVAEQARGGAAEGLVALAGMQSAGRGRLDRTWIAPAGSALLCTVLVRPQMPVARWHWLNLAMAVAAQDAVRLLGVRFGFADGGLTVAVKWPNDLIVPSMGDRKLAGILAEMVLPANGQGAVAVGIGLNVHRPLDVDPEVVARGVWFNEVICAPTNDAEGTNVGSDQPASPTVDEVLKILLTEFERQVAEVEDRPDAFLETYRQRCITVGREVRAMLPSSDIVGTATGIDSDGQLLVSTADGFTHTISAADVVHIRPAL